MFSSQFLLPASLLLAALASPALAQTPAPADTARFYRHHLGLVASPVLDHFFTANRRLPVGLLYKRQTKPDRLWRYGLVLNQDYGRREDYNPYYPPSLYGVTKLNPEYSTSSYGISVSVGREYTRRFSQRWTGTAGADIGVGFSQNTNLRSYQIPGNMATGILSLTEKVGYRQRYYQATLAPFVGLRFQCWPQLYVSAESAIKAYYMRTEFNGLLYVTELYSGKQVAGENDFSDAQSLDYDFHLSYHLISQLSIHYLLGSR